MEDQITSYEVNIKGILKKALFEFTENFQTILLITLIIFIPLFVIYVHLLSYESIFLVRILQVVPYLSVTFYSVLIILIIENSLNKNIIGIKDLFREALSLCPSYLYTYLIFVIFLIGLTLLFIIPGIIYSVYWMFTIFAVVINKKSGLLALRYSKSIVNKNWWKVLGYYTIFTGFLIIFVFAYGFFLGFISVFYPQNIISSIIQTILMTLYLLFISFYFVICQIFYKAFEYQYLEKNVE